MLREGINVFSLKAPFPRRSSLKVGRSNDNATVSIHVVINVNDQLVTIHDDQSPRYF